MVFRAYKNFLDRLYAKRVSGTGLAFFRVAFTSVILGEVFQLYYFRDIVFYLGDTNVVPKLIAWMIVLAFLWLGLFTRTAAVANYVLVLATSSAFTQWNYHHDYTIIGVSFLFMFLPVSRRFSIDSLVEKLRYSSQKHDHVPDTTVPSIYYALAIFAGIGLVYFDAAMWKFGSPMWRAGLGVWTPASLPMTTYLDWSWLLDREWLVKGMSHLVLAFEALFVFAMWFKRFRIPLLFFGVAFHLGITLTFPVPWFGLGMLAQFLLLVPHGWFRRIGGWLRKGETRLTVFYDDACPLCNRGKIIAKHFDLRSVIAFKGIAAHAADCPELDTIPREELLRSMHCVDHRGRVSEGVDTFRKILYYMGYTAPIAALLAVFPFRPLAKAAYAYVASHRFREGCDASSCDISGSPAPLDPDGIKLLSTLGWKDLKVASIGAIMLVLFLSQGLRIVLASPPGLATWRALDLESTRATLREKVIPFTRFAEATWGHTNHSVYLDSMFDHYGHLVRIVYLESDGGSVTEIPLPLNQEDGQAGFYATNRNQVWWNWHANDTRKNMNRLNHGIMLYTRFWIRNKNITRDNVRFLVKIKPLDKIGLWEKGFLRRQLEREWIDAGIVEWKDGKFETYIPDLNTFPPSNVLHLQRTPRDPNTARPRPGHP